MISREYSIDVDEIAWKHKKMLVENASGRKGEVVC
jgi:hypothetical protein